MQTKLRVAVWFVWWQNLVRPETLDQVRLDLLLRHPVFRALQLLRREANVVELVIRGRDACTREKP